MHKSFMITGALLAALAVGMGAFGAHGLKSQLSVEMMSVYKTAVEYHMYHALGLFLTGLLLKLYPSGNLIIWAAVLMMAGLVLFSGSLYVLSISGLRWLGAITPFGGTAFILAWILITVGLIKQA